MENYSVLRMAEELRVNNILLTAVDNKIKRTFAYPCGDTKIRDSVYLDRKDFVAARAVKDEMLPITKIDVYNIGCYSINGQSGEYMISLVKKAMAGNSLLVFLFHGVGGEHDLNVSLTAHQMLLQFLKQHEKEIWVATLLEVADHVINHQSKTRSKNH
jgi:hypothetical protein